MSYGECPRCGGPSDVSYGRNGLCFSCKRKLIEKYENIEIIEVYVKKHIARGINILEMYVFE